MSIRLVYTVNLAPPNQSQSFVERKLKLIEALKNLSIITLERDIEDEMTYRLCTCINDKRKILRINVARHEQHTSSSTSKEKDLNEKIGKYPGNKRKQCKSINWFLKLQASCKLLLEKSKQSVLDYHVSFYMTAHSRVNISLSNLQSLCTFKTIIFKTKKWHFCCKNKSEKKTILGKILINFQYRKNWNFQ